MKIGQNGRYVMGVAGGSASGKTSFLRELQQSLPETTICVVSQDNYYLPKEMQVKDENGEINYDLPTAIDREAFHRDVLSLINGDSVTIKEYNFNNSSIPSKVTTLHPAQFIVVEGLFIFHFTEIYDLYDLRVFISVREDIKLQRRIQRDTVERGYSEDRVRYQWEHHVMPSFNAYLKPFEDEAHLVVSNNVNYAKGLQVLSNHLRYLLLHDLIRSSTADGVSAAL